MFIMEMEFFLVEVVFSDRKNISGRKNFLKESKFVSLTIAFIEILGFYFLNLEKSQICCTKFFD